MRRILKIALRGTVSLIAFLVVFIASYWAGDAIIQKISEIFPPEVGSPETDPRGRGANNAADVGIGSFICIVQAAIGGWLAWLWTDKRHWSSDLAIASPIFLMLSVISSANYIHRDVIYTRDAQAVLNVMLAATGVSVVIILQKSLSTIRSVATYVLGMLLLSFCIYGFVAIPIWFSISFMSWKLGAGELSSLEATAKALGAVATLLAAAGIIWRDGRLSLSEKMPKAEGD